MNQKKMQYMYIPLPEEDELPRTRFIVALENVSSLYNTKKIHKVNHCSKI